MVPGTFNPPKRACPPYSTTILITHRLAILALADRIVVMQDGKIVDIGRHEDLLAKSGLYRRLYQIHFEDLRQTA